jgi:hypothetical protein
MTIDTSTLQTLAAVIFTPALLSPLADIFASILAQDGFPALLNDLIAWLVLLAAAIGSMFAANQFVGGLPALVNVGIGVIFLLVNGSMGKLKPYCVGLDWIQSNIFDVAKGPDGQPEYTFNAAKGWAALLPEIEGIFQRNILPLLHQHQAAPQPTRPEPQPIVLGKPPFADNTTTTINPGLNQPMQWGIQSVPAPVQNPQEMPAVRPANVSQMPTQQTPAVPSATSVEPTSNLLQFAPLTRHWGDTGVVPSLRQPNTGQG